MASINEIFASYPPDISDEQLEYLTSTVKNWTIEHGLTVRPSPATVSDETNPNHVLATNAPVTLFPSPFPRACFEQARSLQTLYSELYAVIASNERWLESIMKDLIEVDDFLAQMWQIHLAVKKEGYTNEYALGMFRSDYMIDAPQDSSPSLKQVEFNTISSSFGGLASLVTQMHTELASFPAPSQPLAYPPHALFSAQQRQDSPTPPIKSDGRPPPNDAVPNLTAGLAAAHQAYGSSKSNPPLPLCILFLVQDNERNIFDQLALSSDLFQQHDIPSFRLPTSAILSQTSIAPTLSNPSRPLIYHPLSSPPTQYEVTVVYFRALYAPAEYTSPTHWAGRHHLERSAAIKCPSILLHLSGSKKIQQVLTSRPPDIDHLSALLPHRAADHELDKLRSTFAPQYSLTSEEGLKLAMDPRTAENHVLKPQREGGGNNIYRGNIPTFLKGLRESEYKAYILMQLIHPPSTAKNTVLRSDGEVVSGEVISELGIFGTCLWKTPKHTEKDGEEGGGGIVQPEIIHNQEGGYLLRTKASGSDEGGVAAGFSSLDSLILYEEA